MNLKQLNDTMDFKWRVQSFSKFKAQGQCVAYIDARDVQKRLDEVCGKENWQALYYEVGSMLFCKIGINIVGDSANTECVLNPEWVWKSDTGSESNIEKEKGHSSDAFKRAAVLWGVGRFLYDMKIQYVDANEKKTNSNFPHVTDSHGQRIWDLTAHINSGKAPVQLLKKPAKKDDFLEKMKGIANNENAIYWKVMGSWGMEKADQIKNKESQEGILKEMNELIKGK